MSSNKYHTLIIFNILVYHFSTGLDYNGVLNLEEMLSFNRYLSGNVRSIRLGITVARMILEYKVNGINRDSHQKGADYLLKMVQMNKGTYVKIGQHVSAQGFCGICDQWIWNPASGIYSEFSALLSTNRPKKLNNTSGFYVNQSATTDIWFRKYKERGFRRVFES